MPHSRSIVFDSIPKRWRKELMPGTEPNIDDLFAPLYCLYDKKRQLWINPVPIHGEKEAIALFAQLLNTPSVYVYQGWDYCELWCLGGYRLDDGKLISNLRKVITGLEVKPKEENEKNEDVEGK